METLTETLNIQSPPWYVLQTKPGRELLVASLLERYPDLPLFLPEVMQPRARGPRAVPLFPGYLFVQLALTTNAAGQIIHTPGVIRLVGPERQPTPVAATVIEALRTQVAAINAKGGLPRHDFAPGDTVVVTAGPLQGLEAVFTGTLTGSQRVQILLQFLGRQQQVTIEAALLEKVNPPPAAAAQQPRRTRGKGAGNSGKIERGFG